MVILIQGAISLKLLGGKLAPKLVYMVLRKELLNVYSSETAPRIFKMCHTNLIYFILVGVLKQYLRKNLTMQYIIISSTF